MKAIKIYGCSDDLVEIENSQYKKDEINCYDSDVRIRFVDGTVIRIGYPKKTILGAFVAVWWIEVEKEGAPNVEQKWIQEGMNNVQNEKMQFLFPVSRELERC